MTHASIPDFSVPMPPRPARADAVVIEHLPLAAPIGRLPGSAAVVTIRTDDAPPAEHRPRIAGDALAALLLIIGGAVVISLATML